MQNKTIWGQKTRPTIGLWYLVKRRMKELDIADGRMTDTVVLLKFDCSRQIQTYIIAGRRSETMTGVMVLKEKW